MLDSIFRSDSDSTISGATPSAGGDSSASEHGNTNFTSKEASEPAIATQSTLPDQKQTDAALPFVPDFPRVKIDPSLSPESAIACWTQYSDLILIQPFLALLLLLVAILAPQSMGTQISHRKKRVNQLLLHSQRYQTKNKQMQHCPSFLTFHE